MKRSTFHKFLHLLAAVFLMAALFCGCKNTQLPPETTLPTQPTEPTEPPTANIGGTEVDVLATELDLTVVAYDLDSLLAAAPRLTQVSQIELGTTELTIEQIQSLAAAFPAADIHYNVQLFDQVLEPETQTLDLSAMDPAQTEELLEKLPLLTGLQEINFVSSEGVCAYDIGDIPELDRIRDTAADVKLRVSFELFGQTVTSEDERIEYYLVPIGNEGVETVRAVLPYLTSCTYFLMDGCDVDNEVMAQLRSDFPETKIVWRVWTVKPMYNSPRVMRLASFLTDTHRVRTVAVTDATCDVLKYCTETKYVDFGHNYDISDFSFLAYMPKLEAAIIGLTDCADISPLVNCPELEYLEIYGSKVTDLSPLAECTKLKHLNISRLEVDDITCLYGLELERFRAVDTNIPQEQIDKYAELHPDCKMLMEGYAPHQNGWRYDENGNKDPRYALLQEQMEYAEDRKYGIQ